MTTSSTSGNPHSRTDAEIAVRRGAIAATAVGVAFVLVATAYGAVAIAQGFVNPLLIVILALPGIPAAWAFVVARALTAQQPHRAVENPGLIGLVSVVLGGAMIRAAAAGQWGYSVCFAAALAGVVAAGIFIGRAGDALPQLLTARGSQA
ncbi:hypothetical protein [Nocardia tengchongensis]|uniref:hypothetical protein n=1 Tax=Nocardia tengchongensis TaxID=2055889 RepID=UPI00364D66B7